MTEHFAVLPAHGYRMIKINDDDGDLVDNRLSEPEIVLGFVIRQQGQHFNVMPVTTFGVYDETPLYALLRPDGKVDLPVMYDHVCESIDDLKQFLRHEAAELYAETADSAKKDGNHKDAALFRRVARKHRRDYDDHNDD